MKSVHKRLSEIEEAFKVAFENRPQDRSLYGAGQVYCDIARAQLSPEALERCRRMGKDAIALAGSYEQAMYAVTSMMIGLTEIAKPMSSNKKGS